MNQSFGAWMLTGGTRGEIDAEARQLEHLRRFASSSPSAARLAEPSAWRPSPPPSKPCGRASWDATTETAPDCCPA